MGVANTNVYFLELLARCSNRIRKEHEVGLRRSFSQCRMGKALQNRCDTVRNTSEVYMELLYVKLRMSGDVLVYRGKPHKDV